MAYRVDSTYPDHGNNGNGGDNKHNGTRTARKTKNKKIKTKHKGPPRQIKSERMAAGSLNRMQVEQGGNPRQKRKKKNAQGKVLWAHPPTRQMHKEIHRGQSRNRGESIRRKTQQSIHGGKDWSNGLEPGSRRNSASLDWIGLEGKLQGQRESGFRRIE